MVRVRSRILIAFGLLLAMPTLVIAKGGAVSKFDDKQPKIDMISQVPLHDIERCLIDLEDHPAPQVYAQADRPNEVRMLWQVEWQTIDRADLQAIPAGTKVKIWLGSKQMLSCATTGKRY